MAGTSQEKRRRIFEAAAAEFAVHGIAGARIDRIAATSGINKRLIYAYFGSKRSLFETVASDYVRRVLEEVPFNPSDLPTFAVALFDFYEANPEVMRVARWHALEPGELHHPIPRMDAPKSMVQAIRKAQAGGTVDDSIPADKLLDILGAIALTWTNQPPERDRGQRPSARVLSARRAAVREAVRRLVEPRAPSRA